MLVRLLLVEHALPLSNNAGPFVKEDQTETLLPGLVIRPTTLAGPQLGEWTNPTKFSKNAYGFFHCEDVLFAAYALGSFMDLYCQDNQRVVSSAPTDSKCVVGCVGAPRDPIIRGPGDQFYPGARPKSGWRIGYGLSLPGETKPWFTDASSAAEGSAAPEGAEAYWSTSDKHVLSDSPISSGTQDGQPIVWGAKASSMKMRPNTLGAAMYISDYTKLASLYATPWCQARDVCDKPADHFHFGVIDSTSECVQSLVSNEAPSVSDCLAIEYTTYPVNPPDDTTDNPDASDAETDHARMRQTPIILGAALIMAAML